MLNVKKNLFFLFFFNKQWLFKNLNFSRAAMRVVRKIMSHFGFKRRHLSQSLHTLSLRLHVAICFILKIFSLSMIFCTDSTVFRRSGPIQRFSWVMWDRGAIPALLSLSHLKWPRLIPPQLFPLMSDSHQPLVHHSFPQQSLTGCWVKAMKSNPAVIGYCRRRGC